MFSNKMTNAFDDILIKLSTFLFLSDEEFESLVLIVNSYELTNSRFFEDESSEIDDDFDFAFKMRI